MITLDLSKTHSNKLRHILSEHAGFRQEKSFLGFKISKGIGGFVFIDKVGEDTIEYWVNLELYPKGIGMYCRSRSNNFLVILPYSNIQRIAVHKEEDVIRARSFSWYKAAMRFGISYERVRFLVLEKEWVRAYPLRVTFYTLDNTEFKIKMNKIRSPAVRSFFNRVTDKVKVDFDIKYFCLTSEV